MLCFYFIASQSFFRAYRTAIWAPWGATLVSPLPHVVPCTSCSIHMAVDHLLGFSVHGHLSPCRQIKVSSLCCNADSLSRSPCRLHATLWSMTLKTWCLQVSPPFTTGCQRGRASYRGPGRKKISAWRSSKPIGLSNVRMLDTVAVVSCVRLWVCERISVFFEMDAVHNCLTTPPTQPHTLPPYCTKPFWNSLFLLHFL